MKNTINLTEVHTSSISGNYNQKYKTVYTDGMFIHNSLFDCCFDIVEPYDDIDIPSELHILKFYLDDGKTLQEFNPVVTRIGIGSPVYRVDGMITSVLLSSLYRQVRDWLIEECLIDTTVSLLSRIETDKDSKTISIFIKPTYVMENVRVEHKTSRDLARNLNKIISVVNSGKGTITRHIDYIVKTHDHLMYPNPVVIEGLKEIIYQYRKYMMSDNDTDIADARSALDQWCKEVRDHLIDHKLYGQTNSLKR